jgi:hypothetical protein
MELLSYMVNMFAIMFWLFRVYVALMVSSGSEIQFTTPGLELEITVIFITLISIFMIFKRNLIFASIYLGTYFAFFTYGIALMNGNISTNKQLLNAMVMIAGIIIALLNFLDVMFNKNRKGSTKDNKTDWFYATDKYEREYDERADRNQYKIR